MGGCKYGERCDRRRNPANFRRRTTQPVLSGISSNYLFQLIFTYIHTYIHSSLILYLFGQVGLVIGKISRNLDRAFVFDLVSTPLNDAGQAASSILETKDDTNNNKSKSKSKSFSSVLSIDKDWVAEHARHVSRMLVGGMKVIGIYICVNETLFKNSTVVLCQVYISSSLNLLYDYTCNVFI